MPDLGQRSTARMWWYRCKRGQTHLEQFGKNFISTNIILLFDNNNFHNIFFAMTSRHILHFLFRCISCTMDPQGSYCYRRRRGLCSRIKNQELRESASEKRWTLSLSPRTSSNLFFNVSRFTGVCELEVVAIIPIPSYLAKLELQHHRLQMKADEDFEDTLLKHLSYEDIWC